MRFKGSPRTLLCSVTVSLAFSDHFPRDTELEKQRAALAELDAQRLSAKGQGLRAEQTGSRAEGNKGATT
eukprot:3042483-Rhodomonas_salina.2